MSTPKVYLIWYVDRIIALKALDAERVERVAYVESGWLESTHNVGAKRLFETEKAAKKVASSLQRERPQSDYFVFSFDLTEGTEVVYDARTKRQQGYRERYIKAWEEAYDRQRKEADEQYDHEDVP